MNRDTWLGGRGGVAGRGDRADLLELPGGHGGFVSRPKEFIELVRRIAR